jgi:proteasome lid subunit RPN8/RPN11
MTATAEAPDVRQLAGESLPSSAFPAGGRQDFRVFFLPAAHDQIWRHASENVSIEICGVLVGRWERDAAGPFAVVSDRIRCDTAKSGFAEVTFTHEAWGKINAEMDTKFADLSIVGWYHSHPDFGVFLSDRDTFIHQHFFSGAGQIAHVVDPVRKVDGVFAWHEGKPLLCPHFWVGEQICVTRERPEGGPHQPGPEGERETGRLADPRDERQSLFGGITTGLLIVCVFLIGWLLSGRLTEWERQRERERALMGAVVYFGQHGVLREGLDDELGKLDSSLHAVGANLERIADRNLKAAGKDAEELKKAWEGVRNGFLDAERNLATIRRDYSLTPDEQAIVKGMIRAVHEIDARELRAQQQLRDADNKSRSAESQSAGKDRPIEHKGKTSERDSASATRKAEETPGKTDNKRPSRKE